MPAYKRTIKPFDLTPEDIGKVVEVSYVCAPDPDAAEQSPLREGFTTSSVGILKGYSNELNSSDPFRPVPKPVDLNYTQEIVLDGFHEPLQVNGNFDIIFHS